MISAIRTFKDDIVFVLLMAEHCFLSALRYFMWVDVVKWLPNNPKSEEKGG